MPMALTVTMADRVTATMAATAQGITTTVMPPHTMADTGQPTLSTTPGTGGTGASFRPPTPTAPGSMAGMVTGDRQERLRSSQRKVARVSAAFFVPALREGPQCAQ